MKKITSILSAILLVFLFSNFTLIDNGNSGFSNPEDGAKYRVPRKVNTIIQKSCYGCHNSDSENEKGKKKLDFDKIGGEYNNIKSAGKLRDISKAILENEMPPEKFLEHYPEKALNDVEKQTLGDWATFESGRLLGK